MKSVNSLVMLRDKILSVHLRIMDRVFLQGGVGDTIGEKVRKMAQEGPMIVRDPIA